ncbi:MAG: dTDP-4-dehydrorhamnose 3,5-epimerase family protein [Gammaproteobacteria bacterium]|nr:dTDP-4-dehydrorhamnose 3,5-epimerase family protein [Gammaproteobacteria bacterium]
MIDGVIITPLKQILDERGKIMHMFRSDSENFRGFGEIYFSCIHPGAIKGWHIHEKMTLNYAVVQGNIKFVLYDDRENSDTRGEVQEVFLGVDNYSLVTVPPLVWNGFKGYGEGMAIVANCTDIPHDPSEISRLSPFDTMIPYDWSLQHK